MPPVPKPGSQDTPASRAQQTLTSWFDLVGSSLPDSMIGTLGDILLAAVPRDTPEELATTAVNPLMAPVVGMAARAGKGTLGAAIRGPKAATGTSGAAAQLRRAYDQFHALTDVDDLVRQYPEQRVRLGEHALAGYDDQVEAALGQIDELTAQVPNAKDIERESLTAWEAFKQHEGTDVLRLSAEWLKPKAAKGTLGAAMRVHHGSRSGLAPRITPGQPFYTTLDKSMADEYANEAILTGKTKSPVTRSYDLDPSGYMSRKDYQKILKKHLGVDAWVGDFPSEAATVEHPPILEELKKRGVKGVRDLWDFGMNPMTERQVMVTLDPETLKPAEGTLGAALGPRRSR